MIEQDPKIKRSRIIAEAVVDFINSNQAPEGRIPHFARQLWIERLEHLVSGLIRPVTEDLLREHDGALQVGHGCEIVVRGTGERLAYFQSFPCHLTAEELAKHNAAYEELRILHAAHAALITNHDRLKMQLEASREASRLRKELSEA